MADHRIKELGGLFRSYLWKYPVHAFVGEIVKAQKYKVNFLDKTLKNASTKNQIIFNYYCNMVNDIIEAYNKDADVYPGDTFRCLKLAADDIGGSVILSYDVENHVIPQSASSYLMAVHSYKCYQYIVTSYAVDLKQFCVEAVEKQLLYVNPDKKPKKVEEMLVFLHQKLQEILEEKLKVTDIQHDNFLTKLMKYSSAVYFLYDERYTISDHIPPMPEDKNEWEKYLVKIYDTILSSFLDTQRSQFELEHSKLLTPYNYQVVDYHFQNLRQILRTTSLSKEEASKHMKACKKPIITMLQEVFKNV